MYKHEMIIEPAKPSDSRQIVVLAHELAESEGESSLISESVLLKDVFKAPSVAVKILVVRLAGELAGFAMYYPGYDLESASVGFHLGDIIVAKKHRRKSIGQALMQAIVRDVQAQGGSWISWTLLRANKAAEAFYLSLGAQQVDISFMAIGAKGMLQLDKKVSKALKS